VSGARAPDLPGSGRSARAGRRRTPQRVRPWRLWWVLTPNGSRGIDDLRSKIASKMTVLSVLAGFSTAIVAQILTQLPEGSPERGIAAGAAALFAVVAVVLIRGLLAYDRLMIP
jgi:hypothetical protein